MGEMAAPVLFQLCCVGLTMCGYDKQLTNPFSGTNSRKVS
jgi:hypothetical protein